MHLLRFIPIKLTLYLVTGILLGHYLGIGLYFPIALVVVAFSILSFLYFNGERKESTAFGFLVGFTTIGIGLLSMVLWQPESLQEHYSHKNIEGNHTWHLKIREVMKPTSFSVRFVALVQGLDKETSSGKVLLNFAVDSTYQLFNIDDELIVYAKASAINPPLNPHQFNYKAYLNGLGITHQLSINAHNYIQKPNSSRTIYGAAAAVRNNIISKLKAARFGEEELGVIQALLLGQRHDISEATYNDYKNAGAVHILAVSGLHIGVLLLLLEFLLHPITYLPKGRTIKLVVIVALLWGFAIVAGLSASIIRAVAMFTFVAYALYLNRPSNTFNILALSMFFILLLFDPTLLFQVGFQMSYAAVFAIVWVYPILQKLWFPKNVIIRKIWQLLSVSIAAQLGVLPISLFYFHQFPGLFFISNILVVPFLGLILGTGILVIALSLFNLLPIALVHAYNFLIGSMNAVVGWVARQETFIFKDISFDRVQLVISYCLIVSFVLVCTKSTFKRTTVLLLSVIAFQIWSFVTTYQSKTKEEVLLVHQNRNSLLMHRFGDKINIMSPNPKMTERIETDYKIANRINIVEHNPLKNSYRLQNRALHIVDSLGVYPLGEAPHYVLLTQSPKLNLERLIDSIRPKYIIADGSNYKSYIERWRVTCNKRKLPFHYTGEKGVYVFTLKN